MTHSILRSRTIAFAVVLAVLSVMQGYLNVFELDAHTEMIVGIAVTSAVTTIQLNIVRGTTQIIEFEKEAGYAGTVTTELAIGGAGCTIMDAPSSTSAVTYKIQAKESGGSGGIVCASGSAATITLMEVAG